MTKKTRRAKARRALLTLSLVLVVAFAAVGGTIAWLTDNATVTNTFSGSEVEISIAETPINTETYKMVPGAEVKKDPYVTIGAESEDCYVFVKLVGTNDFTDFFGPVAELGFGDDWAILSDVTVENGVVLYYVKDGAIAAATKNQEIEKILSNDNIKVLDTVTQTMMDSLAGMTNDELPKLTLTAFAIQSDNVMATEDGNRTIAQIYELAAGENN